MEKHFLLGDAMCLDTGQRNRSGLFTMIELMIVVIIVAILASSSVPLYQGAVSRAYQAEIGASLGAIRTAYRIYYVENRTYELNGDDLTGLDITQNDFHDMRYVLENEEDWTERFILVNGTEDGFIVQWSAYDAFPGNFYYAAINEKGQTVFKRDNSPVVAEDFG